MNIIIYILKLINSINMIIFFTYIYNINHIIKFIFISPIKYIIIISNIILNKL